MTLIPCDLLAADRGVTLAQLREWALSRGVTQACDLRTRCLLYDAEQIGHAERATRITAQRHALDDLYQVLA